jgi:hypothetical protein
MQVRQVRGKIFSGVVLSFNRNCFVISCKYTLTLGSIGGHYSSRQDQRLNTETSRKS